MSYADPHRCPGCRTPLSTGVVCSACGFVFASPEAGQLWAAVQSVDALLAEAYAAGGTQPANENWEVAPGQRFRFADASVCPGCRASVSGGGPSCPSCGLRFDTETAGRLWTALTEADALLDRCYDVSSHETVSSEPSTAGRAMGGVPYEVPQYQPSSSTAQAVRPRSGFHIGVGDIILSLGALLLLVAAIIFITVSWGSIGLGGRTAILSAVTIAAAAGAAVLAVKQLRASAEAVWAIAVGMFILDWFALWEQLDIAGVVSFPVSGRIGFGAVLGALLCSAISAFGRWRLGHQLWVQSALVVVQAIPGSIALVVFFAHEVSWRFSWAVLVSAVVFGLVGFLGRVSKDRLIQYTFGVVAGVLLGLFATSAFFDMLAYSSFEELVLQARGLPAVVVVAMGIGLGLLWPKLAGLGSGVACAYGALLLLVPWFHLDGLAPSLIAASILAFAFALLGIPKGAWWVGPKIGSLILMLLAAFGVFITWTTVMTACFGGAIHDPKTSPFTSIGDGGTGGWSQALDCDLSWWGAVVIALAFGGAIIAMSRWSQLRDVMSLSFAGIAASGLMVNAVLFLLVTLGAPWFTLPLTVLLFAIALIALSGVAGSWSAIVGQLIVLVALGFGNSSDSLWAMTSVAALAALVVTAVVFSDAPRRGTAIVLSTLVLPAAAVGVIQLFDPPLAVPTTVTVAIAAGLLFGAAYASKVRIVIELWAFVLGFGAALTEMLDGSLTWAGVLMTLLGVAFVGAAVAFVDRRWFLVPGGFFFVIGWGTFLAGTRTTTIEAYTLPVAVIALAIGAWAMVKYPTSRTTPVLGVGLVIFFGPSLPMAMADPMSVRAGLLALAAVVALGIGLWRNWQAPFIFGVVTLGLVAFASIWQVAEGIPWWILFAVAGLVLLIIGIRWESSIRHGRSAVRRVASMR